MAGNVLLRDQDHPVAQPRDECNVGGALPAGETLMVEAGVVVRQRGARLAREAPDDAADGLVDLPLQLAVLRYPEPGRDRDLHQAHLAAPSRLPVEEALEAEEAL